MTTNKDALDAVNAIECLKGTSDYTPETFGAFVWQHRETIRAALQTQAELVEALKEARKIIHEHRIFTIGQRFEDDKQQSDLISKIDKAIAKAEKESGE